MASIDKKTEVAAIPHRYSEKWDDSDIIFIVEEEQLHCHYSILKSQSPTLCAMFSGNFKEQRDKPVNLPEKKKESFIIFLDLMYPLAADYDIKAERDVIVDVLKYADEYDNSHVTGLIDRLLVCNYFSKDQRKIDVAMKDFYMSHTYCLDRFKKASFRRIIDLSVATTSGYNSVRYTGTVFDDMPYELKFDILTGFLKGLYDRGNFHYTVSGNDQSISLLRTFADYAQKYN